MKTIQLLRVLIALASTTIASLASANWSITHWAEGTETSKYPVPNSTTVETSVVPWELEESYYPAGEYFETYADESGSFQAPIEISVDATVYVRVKWTNPNVTAPTQVYLKLDSFAYAGVYCQSPGLAGTVKPDNGLDHDPVFNSDSLYRNGTSSGVRYVKINVTNGEVVVPFKVKMTAAGTGTEGSYADANFLFEATISDRSVAVRANQDVSGTGTFYRVQGVENGTGYKTGLAVKHVASTSGTMRGDMGLALNQVTTYQPPIWFANGATTYNRVLGGGWPTSEHDLYNEWWSTNPDDHWSDSVTEWISVTPTTSFSSGTTPSVEHFKSGNTSLQKIRYKALDELTNISGEALYLMTLHGPRQKEEEYKASFSGYLHNPASTVASKYPPKPIGQAHAHSGSAQAETIEYEIQSSQSHTYEATTNSSLSAELQAVLTIQFGQSTTLSSGTQASIGTKRTFSIPVGKSIMLFAVANGTVKFYNWSKWGYNGFEGDDRVVDVDPGFLEIKPVIYTSGTSPVVPIS